MRSTTATRILFTAVLAAVGLAFAGGSAQAATTLSGKHVKKASLPGDRVKANSITGRQVKESSLGLVPLASLAKLADSAKSADTAKTADDAKLLNGRDHTKFRANATRLVTKQAPAVPGPAGGYPSDITVTCEADEIATGGGAAWIIAGFQDGNQPTALDAPITGSFPTTDAAGLPNGWHALGRNFSGTDRALRAYVMCSPKTA